MSKKYNEMEYWSTRSNPNAKNPNIKMIMAGYSFIKRFLGPHDKLLFYGPGVGRDLCVLPKEASNDVYFVDIVDIHKYTIYDLIKQKLPSLKTKDFIVLDSPILNLNQYEDNFFDTAIASQVFLHQKPDYVAENIKELLRVSKKIILTSFYNPNEYYDTLDRKESLIGAHCFNHDYLRIFSELSVKTEYEFCDTQISLMAEKLEK